MIARRVTVIAALIGWIYCWMLFRGVRSEFMFAATLIPSWAVLLMVGVSTLLLGTAIAAKMKLGVWPQLAVAAAIGFLGVVVAAQLVVMQTVAPRVTASQALSASFRSRSIAGAIFIAALPAALLAAGSYGLVTSRIQEPVRG